MQFFLYNYKKLHSSTEILYYALQQDVKTETEDELNLEDILSDYEDSDLDDDINNVEKNMPLIFLNITLIFNWRE